MRCTKLEIISYFPAAVAVVVLLTNARLPRKVQTILSQRIWKVSFVSVSFSLVRKGTANHSPAVKQSTEAELKVLQLNAIAESIGHTKNSRFSLPHKREKEHLNVVDPRHWSESVEEHSANKFIL